MSNLEKFGVDIFTEDNFFDRVSIGKPFRPEHPSFVFVKKGFLKFRQHLNDFELKDNMYLVTDPQSVYEVFSASDDLEIRMINYKRAFIAELSLRFNKLISYRYFRQQMNIATSFSKEDFDVVWESINYLDYNLRYPKEMLYKQEIIENLFSVFCYQIAGVISNEENNSVGRMSRQEEIVFFFLSDLSASHLFQKSVEYYAKRQSMTTRHFSSVVKSVTGRSASQIIAALVVNEAKVYLNSGKKPINEISVALGFSDQYSFSHFFKKHIGISPNQYRAQFVK